MKTHIILLIILIAISSCNQPTDSTPPIFFERDIPISVGNWWKYHSADSIQNKADTLLLSVTSVVDFNTWKEYTCTLSSQNTIVDTVLIDVFDKKIIWHRLATPYSSLSYFELQTPFTEGDAWPEPHFPEINPLHPFWAGTPYLHKKYGAVYTIYNYSQKINSYMVQRVEIAQGIGIVSMLTNSVGKQVNVNENRTLTLLDFHLQ